MRFNLEQEYNALREEIQRLEAEYPDLAVQVFEKPSGMAASSGPQRSMRRAVLCRVILKRGSGEIVIERGEGSWRDRNAKWDSGVLEVGAKELKRDGRPTVQFKEVEH
jgi:hypothetical protein